MAPEHKFATAARLCQEILGGAADGALPLSECSDVIGDALRILASKDIKVAASAKASPDDAMDEIDTAAAMGAAKGRLVSQMMKKHLAEAVIPVIIELKRGMEEVRHPLLGGLMTAAAAMLSEHKAEIEDILAADPQLAKEILYDIRQAEAAEEARAAEAAEEAKVQQIARARNDVWAKTPAAPSEQGLKTPWSCSGGKKRTRSVSRPAGTTGTTPIAADVLRNSVSKSPRTSGSKRVVASLGETPLGPIGGAFAMPPATMMTGKQQHTTKLSRLARASGPLGSTPAASGSPAVPRLSAQSLRRSMRSTGSPAQAGYTTASPLVTEGRVSPAQIQDLVNMSSALRESLDDGNHIELNFAVVGNPAAASDSDGVDCSLPSLNMWNVAPEVVPETTDSEIESHSMGNVKRESCAGKTLDKSAAATKPKAPSEVKRKRKT